MPSINSSTVGTSNVTITATDINGSFSKVFPITVGDFYPKGCRWSIYDIVFWQAITPSENDPSKLDSIIPRVELPTNTAIWAPLKMTAGPVQLGSPFTFHDGYTTGYRGVIVPSLTGVYMFTMNYADGGQFTISKSNKFSLGSSSNRGFNKAFNNSAKNTITDTVYMVAGKEYAYYCAYWTVFSEVFALQWVYLGANPTNVTTVTAKNMPVNAGSTSFLAIATSTDLPEGINYSIPGFNASTGTPNRIAGAMAFSILGTGGLLTTYPYSDYVKPNSITGMSINRIAKDRVDFKWNKSFDSTSISKYNVYLDGVLRYSTKSNKDTAYVFKGLVANTTYNLFVTAVDVNSNESFPSVPVVFTTPGIENITPSVPTILSINILGDMSAKVSWSGATDNASGIFGYKIFVDGNTLPYNLDTLNATTIILKTFQPLSVHNFQVQAMDGNFNVSALSSALNFTMLGYNPMLTSPGIKKLRMNLSKTFVGKIDGFGINASWENASDYNSAAISRHLDLNPGMVRWGALSANRFSYASKSGPSAVNGVSYARFINFANTVDALAQITLGCDGNSIAANGALGVNGVNSPIDWRDESTVNVTYGISVVTMTGMERTAHRFINYLFAPDSMATKSVAGSNFYPFAADVKKRLDEGYRNGTLTGANFKGLILEFGNEPWGGTIPENVFGIDYNADGFTNYITYGKWCRQLAKYLKASPYFDSTKVKLAYAGRKPQPANSLGLHDALFSGTDVDRVDLLSLGGYLGENLNYVKEVAPSSTELGYYKNGIELMYQNTVGLYTTMNLDNALRKRQRPFFFYESAMTTSVYNQRHGQAIVLTDYLLSTHKAGAYYPGVFALAGGEWGITSGGGTVLNPMYRSARLINNVTKGNRDILNVTYDSFERLVNDKGTLIGNNLNFPEPVSINAYHKNGIYTLILVSRDFENDYQVQVNLPTGMLLTPTFAGASMFTLTATGDYSATSSSVLTTPTSIFNNMIVTVPKHSMLVFTFGGEVLTQNSQQLGYTAYQSPLGFNVQVENPSNPGSLVLSEEFGNIFLNATVTGGVSSTTTIGWTFTHSNPTFVLNTSIENSGKRFRINAVDCQSNGTLTVTSYLIYNPNLRYTYVVTITGQTVCTPTISQNITGLPSSMTKTFGDASFNLSAIASSGLSVTYASSNTSIASIFGNQVDIVGGGTTTITASQVGDGQYLPATNQTLVLTVNKANQNITGMPSNLAININSSSYNFSASASSSLPVSYASSNTSIASFSGNQLLLSSMGVITVTASQAGNGNYTSATSISIVVTISSPSLPPQTITYTPISTKLSSDGSFAVLANASSGLAVSLQVLSGPAAISDNTLTLNGNAGTVVLRATQAGNGSFSAAPSIDFSFNVTSPALQNQTIAFADIPAKITTDAPFTLSATASSALSVSYTLVQGPATLVGNQVTLNGSTGIITIRATQSGSSIFNPATSVDKFILVNNSSGTNQTINFPAISDKMSGASFTLAASATSSLSISYAVLSGPASINGSTVNVSSYGDVTIRASQIGNGTFNQAPYVDQTFNVCQSVGGSSVTLGISGTNAFCFGQNRVLTPSISYPVMQWSNGASSQTLTVTNSGNFTVTVGSGLCKVVSNTVTIAVQNPISTPICMVTVDETSGKNKVIFEKPTGYANSITGWSLYRESSVANQYLLQTTLLLANLSEYVDNTANPVAQAYRYKLETKDNCNNSLQSAAHKTMHLTINKGQNATTWNLIWTLYEGVPLATHRIYRGTTASNLTFLADVAGSISSYTDAAAPAVSNIYYVIELVTTQSCNPTARTEAYTTVRSNVAETATTAIETVEAKTAIKIYPNPTSGTFIIESETSKSYEISDIVGKVLSQGTLTENKTEIVENLPTGIYIVSVGNERVKLVVR